MRVSLRGGTFVLIAIAVAGCSATVEQEVFQPDPRAEPDARPYMRNATQIGLGEGTVFLYPVALSERVKTVYGPLMVLPTPSEEKKVLDQPLVLRVGLEAPGGAATADFSKTAVTLGGRTLYPTSVRADGTPARIEGPVHVVGQRKLRNLVLPHVFELSYEVRTTELEPFSVQLPEIQVNGRGVTPKPVPFGRGTRDQTRL